MLPPFGALFHESKKKGIGIKLGVGEDTHDLHVGFLPFGQLGSIYPFFISLLPVAGSLQHSTLGRLTVDHRLGRRAASAHPLQCPRLLS